MNRRTLIFICLLTISFFGMQYWMDLKKPNRPIPAAKQEKVIIQKETSNSTISTTTKDLKVVPLYSDSSLTRLATYAVRDKDHYLTLIWQTTLPNTLYVENQNLKGAIDQLSLNAYSAKEVNQPVIYSLYPLEKIEFADLPFEGDWNVELVYFTEQNQEYHLLNGVAHGHKELSLIDIPPSNALVFLNTQDKYLPFAFFNPSENKLKPFLEFPQFAANAIDVFPKTADQKIENQQQFYVLENEFQQLVFSNFNGSLVEINLPFYSDKNPQSVVREIEIDRIMRNQYPNNDYFPEFPFYLSSEKKSESSLKTERSLGKYYPLIRRSILGAGGKISSEEAPAHYALNILSSKKASDVSLYKLTRLEKNLIEFQLSLSNQRIIKTFSFPKQEEDAPYCFDLTIKIEGDAKDLFLTTGIPEVELISGNFSPALKYKTTRNQKTQVDQIDASKTSVNFSMITPDWICNGNGFFGIILDPLSNEGSGFEMRQIPGQLAPTRLSLIDAQYKRFPAEKYPGYNMLMALNPSGGTMKFRVYAGPFDSTILTRVDRTYTDPVTGYNPDYIATQSYHGFFSFISEPFAKFLFILMKFFFRLTHSWGFSIILLTVALRIMLYPLNNWSIKSTLKLQRVTPKISAIQEKYKKDPKRAQMEILTLYRENGVNPFSGCFPILIQIPFLIGMFDLLKSTFELRGVAFIPGWINNLTAPDVIFSWNYPIIFFGNSFHFLPILLGIAMYFQQKWASPKTKVSTTLPDQQKQQKFMSNIMVIVFTVMFYHFPSGLNIYWLSSMLLGILQQWWTMKKLNLPTVSVINK